MHSLPAKTQFRHHAITPPAQIQFGPHARYSIVNPVPDPKESPAAQTQFLNPYTPPPAQIQAIGELFLIASEIHSSLVHNAKVSYYDTP